VRASATVASEMGEQASFHGRLIYHWRGMAGVASETLDNVARHSFDARVSRLAQYRPFDDGGIGLEACLTELAVLAVMENGGRFESLAECREAFVILWDYEVEIDELRIVVDTLVERRSARRVEQMVVDLFSSPYVGYRSPVSAVAVEAVVGRIDEFADADLELGGDLWGQAAARPA
jgi:hypothetical protein